MSDVLWVGCQTNDDSGNGLTYFTGAKDADGVMTRSTLPEMDLQTPGWFATHGDAVFQAIMPAPSAVVGLELSSDLKVTSTAVVGGDTACHIAVSADGHWLASAQYSSAEVALVTLQKGQLGAVSDVLKLQGNSNADPDRQEASHPHHVEWLDDDHLMVCDLGADLVRIFCVVRGKLVQSQAIETPAGFGPRHLVTRRINGRLEAVVNGELSGELLVIKHKGGDWTKGWTTHDLVPSSIQDGPVPSGIRLIDDTHLINANRTVNTLAFFTWDEEGHLTLTEEIDCGGDHPRDFIIDGDHIFVANMLSNNVVRLTHDEDEWTTTADVPVDGPLSLLLR